MLIPMEFVFSLIGKIEEGYSQRRLLYKDHHQMLFGEKYFASLTIQKL